MTNTWDQDQYIKTMHFAAMAHREQLYPGTELPYLLHLSLVSMEVMSAVSHHPECDGNLALSCALLHDVVEDTAISIEQIRTEFGDTIAGGVMALTKNKTLPKEQRMKDSLQRIKQQPREVWMVKLGDRITNLQEPPKHWTKGKIQEYLDEAIVIHDELKAGSSFLAQRLLGKIENYRHLYF